MRSQIPTDAVREAGIARRRAAKVPHAFDPSAVCGRLRETLGPGAASRADALRPLARLTAVGETGSGNAGHPTVERPIAALRRVPVARSCGLAEARGA